MEAVKEVSIKIDGWVVELEIPFEFTACPGYPATRDEPGEPEHIEEITFEDEIVKPIIFGEVSQIELSEGVAIKFDMENVLDDIQKTLDEDEFLHIELLNQAKEGDF